MLYYLLVFLLPSSESNITILPSPWEYNTSYFAFRSHSCLDTERQICWNHRILFPAAKLSCAFLPETEVADFSLQKLSLCIVIINKNKHLPLPPQLVIYTQEQILLKPQALEDSTNLFILMLIQKIWNIDFKPGSFKEEIYLPVFSVQMTSEFIGEIRGMIEGLQIQNGWLAM